MNHEPGSYYTKNQVSTLLVDQFMQHNPSNILDLGAGHGSLCEAARVRWPSSRIHATELNIHGLRQLNLQFRNIQVTRKNGLDSNIHTHLKIEPGAIDVAVCNPPYLHFKKNPQQYKSLLTDANLTNCIKLPNITTDILFLAQNLRLLKKDGELGIIVPDGVLTNKNFLILRDSLLNNHQIFGIIQLPEKIFPHTEALTHILLIRRDGISEKKIPLHIASYNGCIQNTIQIKTDKLLERMDYRFWAWEENNLFSPHKYISLQELGAEIKRGSYTKLKCKNLSLNFFHTTDFSQEIGSKIIISTTKTPENNKGVVAHKNDILLARVGKRCIGKVTLISEGAIILTDCVYRIRLPERFILPTFYALRSEYGQEWLKAYAHGVCAQVISKSDLLRFPVNILS